MKIKTKHITLVSLFAALTAISAYLSIPVQPVAISLQTLVVLLSGMILGSKLGALSQIVYILIGLAGLPVFTGGYGGIAVLSRPSFGYAIGFILGAYVSGRICETFKKHDILKYSIASILGTLGIYLLGLPYFYYIINMVMGKSLSVSAVLKSGLIIFLPGDIIKAIVAIIISWRIVPIINKFIAH